MGFTINITTRKYDNVKKCVCLCDASRGFGRFLKEFVKFFFFGGGKVVDQNKKKRELMYVLDMEIRRKTGGCCV